MLVAQLKRTNLLRGEAFSRPPPATLPSNKTRDTASTVTKLHTRLNIVGTRNATGAGSGAEDGPNGACSGASSSAGGAGSYAGGTGSNAEEAANAVSVQEGLTKERLDHLQIRRCRKE